jgi:hypothetical protein
MSQDHVVKRALQRRASLEAEIQRIDLFLSLYQEFAEPAPDPKLGPLAEMPEMSGPTGAPTPAAPPAPATRGESREMESPSREPSPRGIGQEDFNSLAQEIILKAGKPMTHAPILEIIHRMGRRIGGKDEAANLKTKLWRAKEAGALVLISGAGYWPTDIDCASVGYVARSPAMQRSLEEAAAENSIAGDRHEDAE